MRSLTRLSRLNWLGLSLLALSTLLVIPTAHSQPYDLIINNGRVIDPESGLNDTRSLAIRDGKIVALSPSPFTPSQSSATQVIDAGGEVVGPGFIDYHAHGGTLLSGRLQAFDGVTTAIEGEMGQLPVGLAYARAKKQGRAINYGWTASWILARMQILTGLEPDGTMERFSVGAHDARWTQAANAEQQAAIVSLIEDNLRDGALGVGLNLGYARGAAHGEVRALSQLAAREQVPVMVHPRFWGGEDPGGDIAATQEIVSNAITTGAHWYMCHVSLSSVEAISEMVTAARAKGARIDIEALVSETGSTFLGAEFLAPDKLASVSRGLKSTDILYYGRPIASDEELERLRKLDPAALIFLLHRDAENNMAHRATQRKSFEIPGVIIGSDAMPWKNRDGSYTSGDAWPLPQEAWAHPRSMATFTRFLQLWVNEWQHFTLMDAFRMGSYRTAKALEDQVPMMKHKGRIKVGADADLLIFNPAKIQVKATLSDPLSVSKGMRYVIVNGVPVIAEGELDVTALPGRAVRR